MIAIDPSPFRKRVVNSGVPRHTENVEESKLSYASNPGLASNFFQFLFILPLLVAYMIYKIHSDAMYS